LHERLDAMRAQLSSRDATSRQLTTKALVEGDSLHGVGLITIVICWALFGGVGLYLSVDHDVPLGRFVRSGEPATRWWLLWSIAVGLSTSLALLEAGVARIRGLGAEALPAPPIAEGKPPRCRYCAAELPPGTALRRCGHCQSDNLVITGHYLRAERNLDRALDAIVQRFDTNLQKRIDRGNSFAMFGGVAPFFLLFIGAAIGLITPGDPRLWLVPAATTLLAVTMAVVARLRRLPVEALELLGLGQEVYVRGEPNPSRIVSGQLMLGTGPVSLLGATPEESNLAVATSRADGAYRVTVYRVKPGKGGVDEREREQVVPVELWRHVADGPPTIDHLQVLRAGDRWRTFTDDGAAPHLDGNPSGKPPVIVVM